MQAKGRGFDSPRLHHYNRDMMQKLLRSNHKFGRCPIHGQGCVITDDIRSKYINRHAENQAAVDAGMEDYYDEIEHNLWEAAA